jgi:NADH-quinone oxidoreductase subunit E
VIQLQDDFEDDRDGPRTTELIAALRRGEPPKPGPTIDRLNSAPIGGQTTLLEG